MTYLILFLAPSVLFVFWRVLVGWHMEIANFFIGEINRVTRLHNRVGVWFGSLVDV